MESSSFSPLTGIPARLKAERTRLGFSQQKMADLGAISRKSQVRYESHSSTLDIHYLARLAEHGVNVAYVLTGLTLTATENQLLVAFNAAPAAVQVAILAALQATQPSPAAS